jgi:16S rRNA (cytidine1402-2'-O)-methyltransferase
MTPIEGSSAPLPPPDRLPPRLVLIPNTLDFGANGAPIEDLLAHGVLARAAGLSHWVVEDARSARAFLKRVGQLVPLATVLQQIAICELPRRPKGSGSAAFARDVLSALLAPLREGHDVGVLSEAGLPGVADPGRELVAAAHAAGFGVQVLPGASSITLAVAASGLSGQSFAFVGYLPVEADARRARLQELEHLSRRVQQTQVFIETPYRNPALLQALLHAAAGTSWLSVSLALTTTDAWTRTARIDAWRREPSVLPDRLPAVFCLLGER